MRPSARVLVILLAVFVLSGAAGLIYEVVWARQLVLVFGNTSQAVSTILTGFFGGIAVGGALGGRLADRIRRPLLLYGSLELALAVVVLLTPVTFGLIGTAYQDAYPALAARPIALALVRFGLAIAALAPATILMGATLPTLTRFLTARSGFAGAFTRLYAANTVGAILGAALAGFALIELLGLGGALLVGAGCSTAAGVIALGLAARLGGRLAPPPAETTTPLLPSAGPGASAVAGAGVIGRADAGAATPRALLLALALAFASGLTALGYQVVWNRLVAAGTGDSTYVFTIILTLFLVGIAAGAVLSRPLVRVMHGPRGVIATGQIATAACVLAGAALALDAPGRPFLGERPDFVAALAGFAGSTAIVVLPATVAIGLTFPATAALLGDETGTEGWASGSLLAVNTLGAIVATFVLPFFVIPLVGSPATLAGLAAVNAAIGISLAATWAARRPLPAVTVIAGVIVLALIVGSFSAGAAFRDPTVQLLRSTGGRVYQATEDEIASVIAGDRGAPQVWVGGTSMTAITVDTKLMPLLPLMVRPGARRALVIAFGMGTAFRMSLRAGVATDAVELVPSVPRMFPWFYPDAAAVLADPRGRVIVSDGRNYVELSRQTYDVIVVDPPPPIESSGVSVISTQGFYQAARARLVPGGVMMQWVPYGQTLDEFLTHVRTFASVFREVNVIAGPGWNGFFMLGSDASVAMPEAAVRAVLARPGVLADLDSAPDSHGRSIDQWVATLEGLVWASGDRLRRMVGPGPIITDDRPLPEYFLLRRLTDAQAPPLSLAGLRALASSPP